MPKPRILCVGRAFALKTLEVELANAGFAATLVSSGDAALQKLSSRRVTFDLLIAEFGVPSFSALELVRAAREKGFAGGIIVHGRNVPRGVAAVLRMLNVDCIARTPTNSENLVRLVQSVLIG